MPEAKSDAAEAASRGSDTGPHLHSRPGNRTLVGPRLHDAVGVLLVAVAGYVDAIGYIALGGFFASFMSGASIALGIGISEANWSAVPEAGRLIAAFLAGAVAATVIAGRVGVWALPAVLVLEGALLAGAVGLLALRRPLSVCILPVVAAMGVQNTALRPVDGVRLGVTFMTGTLVSLAQALGRALLGNGRAAGCLPHALLWCAFIVGAGSGAAVYAAFGFVAVSGSAVFVASMAVLVAARICLHRRNRVPRPAA